MPLGSGLSMRNPTTLDPTSMISRLESDEPLPDDDPGTRNGGLDPTRQQDQSQIQFYAQARQNGAISDKAWNRLIQRNPRSATLFSTVGINPEVSANKQRSQILGKYFAPAGTEQVPLQGPTPTGDALTGTYERETAPKADLQGAVVDLLSKGDLEGAKSLIDLQTKGKESGKASEAKLIQVDTQDDKGNKITELRNPYTGDLVKTVKGSPKLLSDSHVGKLQTYSDAFDRIDGLNSTFDDRFGGFVSKTVGEAAQGYRKRFGDEVAFVQWWQTYQDETNAVRKELFGSALTNTEKAEFERARINPGMSPQQIRANLSRQKAAAQRAAQKLAKPFTTQNFDRRMVYDALGRNADTILSEQAPTTKEVLEENTKDSSASRNVKQQLLDELRKR